MALQRLSAECGMEDVIPRAWVEKIVGVLPGVGYHVRWHGMWSEQAR